MKKFELKNNDAKVSFKCATVYVDDQTYKTLNRLAKQSGASLSNIARQAVVYSLTDSEFVQDLKTRYKPTESDTHNITVRLTGESERLFKEFETSIGSGYGRGAGKIALDCIRYALKNM